MLMNNTRAPFLLLLTLAAGMLIFSQCTPYRSASATAENRTTIKGDTKEDRLRADIVDYAREFVGTKYRYAGKDPKGFDCSGFTWYVFREFDVELSASSRLQAEQGKSLRSVSDARPGDLVFFSKGEKGRGKINHVGLVVSNDSGGLKVIHSTSRGVIIDSVYESSYWRTRVLEARSVL